MEGSTGAPPQRVCPKCARISWATGPRCPYCQARFRRRGGVTPAMLAGTAAVLLVAIAVMFLIAGRIAEDRLDERIEKVNRDFESSLNKFREEVRREIEGSVQPTPTPYVPPAVTPSPSPEGDGSVTPTATPTPASSPDAGADGTGDEGLVDPFADP